MRLIYIPPPPVVAIDIKTNVTNVMINGNDIELSTKTLTDVIIPF